MGRCFPGGRKRPRGLSLIVDEVHAQEKTVLPPKTFLCGRYYSEQYNLVIVEMTSLKC